MSFKDPNSGRLIIFRLFTLVIMLAALFCAFSIFDISAQNIPSPTADNGENVSLAQPTASPESSPTPTPSQTVISGAEPSPSPSPSEPPPDTPEVSDSPEVTPPDENEQTPTGESDGEYTPPVSLPPRGSSGVFENGKGESIEYTWGYPLPESDAVEDTWFSDAAFIGNSLCDGLMLYGGLKGTTFFGAKSITVMNVYTEKSINTGNGYISITDALARKQYGKVFITLGINEIYLSSTQYYNKYSDLIDYVRSIEPNAEIYLTAISPVTQAKSNSGGSFTRANVLRFNEQIMKLSADKKCYYVDVYTALADENGYLPSEGSTDGVHLKRAYYEKWADYLRTHSITELGLEEVDVSETTEPNDDKDPETTPDPNAQPETDPDAKPGDAVNPTDAPNPDGEADNDNEQTSGKPGASPLPTDDAKDNRSDDAEVKNET